MAALLLLVFSFLHVAKAAHHHTSGMHTDSRHNTFASPGPQSCDICDFQLAKDGSLPTPFCIENISTSFTRPFAVLAEQLPVVNPLFIPGRGPPCFI